MKSKLYAIFAALALCSSLAARRPAASCGTYNGKDLEERYLHSRAEERRPATARSRRLSAARSANADFGDIAVIEDADGVIARRNPFNLDGLTLTFAPSGPAALRYRLLNSAQTFDNDASAAGTPITGLGDDDAREAPLPFAFPFYGRTYSSVWVNSNGNLTFGEGDGNTTEQSLGRLLGGAPRIAPLFCDLDPSAAKQGAIRVAATSSRAVITFDRIPLYSDSGNGSQQTFQIRLYPDGRIEIAFNGITTLEAVTGISPGRTTVAAILPLAKGSSDEFAGAVAEVFAGYDAVDMAVAAQKFYATHEDAYDYLAVFNASGVSASPTAVAYEVTVRNTRTGYGDRQFQNGAEYGSAQRLQAVLNMGPLEQYPANPTGTVDLRRPAGDTPLSILGHEAGHLFLAFVSVADPANPQLEPMLGTANVHWAFTFNSEASLLEGNRIVDNGATASPRFTTTKTVEGYAPLDQYLMGFIPPEQVPPTFYVSGSRYPLARIPQTGVSFDGARHDVKIEDVIAVAGRRTPDSTVAQRRFRFGFVLIVPPGATPAANQLAQVEAYRAAFEGFYAKASGGHATADATLKRAVHLSAWPAAGILRNYPGAATLTLDAPARTPVTFFLDAPAGIAIPQSASVTVPAGSTSVSFAFNGSREGVEEFTVRPADPGFETVLARIQVRNSPDSLRLASIVPGATYRVSDVNGLPYSGIRLRAGDRAATTGADGSATFSPAVPVTTQVTIEGAQSVLNRPVLYAAVNAASYADGITPGAFGTIFGAALDETVQVLVNDEIAALSYVSAGQLNFRVPEGIAGSTARVTMVTPATSSIEYRVLLKQVSPGIFAVVSRGTALEIYATGLNGATPEVTVAGIPARVLYSGQPQFPGVDQINVAVPAGVPPGSQSVVVTAGGVKSNEYRLAF